MGIEALGGARLVETKEGRFDSCDTTKAAVIRCVTSI